MTNFDHFFDVFIEHAERVRVGQHHADDGIVAGGFEGFQVNVAARIRWDGDNAETHHASRGGVCAMRGIGDEHLGAFAVAA